MRAKFKSSSELKNLITKYLTTEKHPTPRHFRVYLGLIGPAGKSLISQWRTSQPELYNLIKEGEDIIMGNLEKLFTYGGKEFYNIIYTLRAYDREQYIEIKQIDEATTHEPVQIILDIPEPKKVTAKGGKRANKPK